LFSSAKSYEALALKVVKIGTLLQVERE